MIIITLFLTFLEENLKKEEYIQNIKDLEILKKIINKEILIKDVEYNTKKRLIVLCKKRTEEIREKIRKSETNRS